MNVRYLLVIVPLLIFLFIHLSKASEEASRMPDRMFFNVEQTQKFLRLDRDRYVGSMSECDLYARKVRSPEEYIDKIAKCAISFSEKEKVKLVRCAKKADDFLRGHRYRDLDCSEIASIEWVFAKTHKNEQSEYEEGLPHTRDNVVFLSSYIINENIADDTNDDFLVSTLIHEKAHIYQRQNNVALLVESMGYREVPMVDIDKRRLLLKRCNPDTDERIYSKNNHIVVFVYKSNRPSGINDVETNNFTIEHPYEEMAYELANDYSVMRMRKVI